jgi:thymidylate kinase
MKYITFSGVDGSGKSTQLELLREHLIGEGFKVAYFHAVEFSFANRIARRFKDIKNFQPGQEKAVTKASLLTLLLRQKLLFLDLFRFRRFLTRLEREGYDYVLSDRSFFDSLIHLEYLALPHRRMLPFLLWRTRSDLLESFLPKPDIAFYLDLDPKIIMSRERTPEQGIEYLHKKQSLFRTKMNSWNMHLLAANRPKELIFDSLLTVLRER